MSTNIKVPRVYNWTVTQHFDTSEKSLVVARLYTDADAVFTEGADSIKLQGVAYTTDYLLPVFFALTLASFALNVKVYMKAFRIFGEFHAIYDEQGAYYAGNEDESGLNGQDRRPSGAN